MEIILQNAKPVDNKINSLLMQIIMRLWTNVRILKDSSTNCYRFSANNSGRQTFVIGIR
jgi:hypothetical protein